MSRSTDSSIDADGFHVSTRDRSESDNDNALNVSTGKVSSGRDGRSRHSAFDDELDELENIAMLLTPAQRLRAWLQGDAGLALQGIHLSFATFLLLLFVGAALAVPCILGTKRSRARYLSHRIESNRIQAHPKQHHIMI